MNSFDKQHKRNLTQYEQQIASLMEEAQQQVARMVTLWARDLKQDEPFRWADYPVANGRMQTVVKQLTTDLQQSIENGITQEWQLSNQKNDDYTQSAFGEYLQQLPDERRNQYLNNNQEALQAFKQRKVNGLNLSARVWNITKEYQEEVEMAIDTAIRDGLPATTLATRLKQYLRNPDALFRRVRNRWGELELSKHARAYHPGQGVYRSAYKNARRTAATEINIAYRTSDYDRWQQMDFVVGIQIEPSHTNHPDYDLCDTLKGKYPKGFKFTGWHPHCRCIATPILKTRKEMQQDAEKIMQGEAPTEGSKNGVNNVPPNFSKWVKQNQQRIRRNSMPYFLKDNGRVNSKGEYEIKPFPQLHKDTPITASHRNLLAWFDRNAPTVTIGNKFTARRFVVQTPRYPVIIAKNFYKETISKYIEDPLYPQKLEYARQAHQIIPKAHYVRTEPGKHHQELFDVYEYKDGSITAEFKIRICSDGAYLYVMRLYKK
jgi:hypothetical protein